METIHHDCTNENSANNIRDEEVINSKQSFLALHVALQTLKERCQSLQHRLSNVEAENLDLKIKVGSSIQMHHNVSSANDEIHCVSAAGNHHNHYNSTDIVDPVNTQLLHRKIDELTQQKSQLSEHISMVATENRQLWSRLSKLTKDNEALNRIKDSLITASQYTTSASTIESNSSSTPANGSSQNLIRSKTFTQNAPNPILRQKIIKNQHLLNDHSISDKNISLEEISLKVLNEFLEGKAEIEKKCTEMVNNKGIDFGYLNEDIPLVNNIDSDIQVDAKKCMENMFDFKKDLLRQQNELKLVIHNLVKKRDLLNGKKNIPKPVMIDKNLATDDTLLLSLSSTKYDELPLKSINILSKSKEDLTILQDGRIPPIPLSTVPAPTSIPASTTDDQLAHNEFLEQKRIADFLDKICPMCGKLYPTTTTFAEFQDHVELHFIDDSELELSIDKTYELISHSVGNF